MQVYLAIDQGTTSSRAMVFAKNGKLLITDQKDFPQFYPNSGWVEHDPEIIWTVTLETVKNALCAAKLKGFKVAAIGITNQRETVVIWDKKTGKAIYNSIVWQDRRTLDVCENLKEDGCEELISSLTGLVLDPYFSATKISWILDHVAGARAMAESGNLAFGTVDCFLLWRLTNGSVHATDATNASRTSLFNISSLAWDARLLEIFNVPRSILPEVFECAHDYGLTSKSILGDEIPILAVLGDQQAAAFGQACFDTGSLKATYGTGGFLLLNTGSEIVRSKERLISTVLFQLDGEVFYALEGSIFIAGAAVQWLRDEIGIINSAKQSEVFASLLNGNDGVYLVPSFTGLGAPHWRPEARGALYGITRNTSKQHITRAALESVAYQTVDIVNCMSQDGIKSNVVKVDGGMADNFWFVQFLADILGTPVKVPKTREATALGAAMMAAVFDGQFSSFREIENSRTSNQTFYPKMDPADRQALLSGWNKAVSSTLSNSSF